MTNLHPGIFLILAGLVITLFPKRIRQVLLIVCPAITFLLALQLTIGTSCTIEVLNHTLIYLELTKDNYAFLFVFSLMALLGGIYSCHRDNKLERFASMAYAGGALGVTLAGDWLTFLFFWEFMAVTSLLIIWSANTKRANSAGMHYLFIHILGGSMLLFGVLLKVYAGASAITILTGTHHDIAYWFIFLGFAINGAVVPLHAWVPDAYPEAPPTGSVYLSSFTTKLTILCMLRVFAGSNILIYLGIIMMLYGACFALIENNIRRLLSYHIISQLGFMVIDVGIGTEFSLNAASSLAFGNVLYKSLLFMCAGAIIYATGTEKINQLGRLAKRMPLLCICFFIAALSIAGVPLFCGFTCKSLSMVAAEHAGYHWIELLMMLGSIGTALSIPFKMGYFIFFGKERNLEIKPIPKNMYVAMVIGAVSCMIVGLCPGLFYQMLPYAMDYQPYTVGHVLEYMQLLPAALIPFMMYLNKMEPHSMLTLDTDWFARKPFWTALKGISTGLCALERFCAGIGRKCYHSIQRFSFDPVHKVIRRQPNTVNRNQNDSHFYGDAYRSKIGNGMIGIFVLVIILTVYFVIRRLT